MEKTLTITERNGRAELDLPACVRRVRRRDEEAARQLIQHLYPFVLKIVRAHLPRRTSEEDLAQTIFMKMFASIHQYSGAVPIEHWVSRIAVNTCLNHLRMEKVRPEWRWADLSEEECEALNSLHHTSSDAHPADALASREVLDRMLSRLSPDDRLLMEWLHIEERSVDEIRALTGWSRSMVKVRAFRARNKLRKHLNSLMQEAWL